MFRKDFVWGAATSSYQIEGATSEDGKGVSIWDVFAAQEGNVLGNHTGKIACDHYHRFREDVALMKKLGLKAYRFSLSWPRILPEGIGKVNQKGIAFYNALIDELIVNGIEPYLTLYHWELPYTLHQKGGWLNPDIVNWFGEYAKVVAENFSDRVKFFLTVNEPQCFIGLGYVKGVHAPGVKALYKDTFQMAHYALMAHGNTVVQLRKHAKRKIQIGYAPTAGMTYPASEQEEDIKAAKEFLFSANNPLENWAWNVTWFSDPVFFGKYPEDALEKYKNYMPDIKEGDMELIAQPLDFMGQNIYNGVCIKAGDSGKSEIVERYEGFPKTATNWPITPKCIYWGAKYLYERYQKPLYLTENGVGCHDVISIDGKVHDPNRIDFLERYLSELKKAAADGVDLRGYFVWSLLDNFEWDRGYTERFGLIYVDYRNQKRIVKDSGYWYKQVIKKNGENLTGSSK